MLQGAELLAQYIVADRIREAKDARLVRLARSASRVGGEPISEGRAEHDVSYIEPPILPRLHGYPFDPLAAKAGEAR